MIAIIREDEYQSYVIFDISKDSFEDIKNRLTEAQRYKSLTKDKEGREIIVFGTTALRSE